MDVINELLRRHELDRPNDIKNDEETKHNAMIVELEEYDAVVTVPSYFNYFQCQTTEGDGNHCRNVNAEHLRVGQKMVVIVLLISTTSSARKWRMQRPSRDSTCCENQGSKGG